LSLFDGTNFSGSVGSAQSFAAGADVFLAWDAHDAAQSAKLDLDNTFTGDNTMSGGMTFSGTTKTLRVAQMTTTQRDAIASPSNGMMIYNTTTGVMNQYIGGAWTTFATGSVTNAADGTAGKVDLATTTELAALTATDASSSAPNVVPVSACSITTATSGKVPVLNSGGKLDVAIGGTGVASPTSGNLLLGAGSSAMTLLAPSTSKNVVTSNGSTFTSTAQQLENRYSAAAAATAVGASSVSENDIDTNYTIPANDWAVGAQYEVFFSCSAINIAAGNLTIRLKLGSTTLCSATSSTNTGEAIGHALITCRTIGATGTVSSWFFIDGFSADYTDMTSSTTIDTTGTNVLKFSAQFDSSNAGNSVAFQTFNVRKINAP
jgi:hypothetical protein